MRCTVTMLHPRELDLDGNPRPFGNCGHAHETLAAAKRCLRGLMGDPAYLDVRFAIRRGSAYDPGELQHGETVVIADMPLDDGPS